jgi:hypothetical protein
VGRMIEIYNPKPWLTLGGMGSKKLHGDNIEYIENDDSHPGAQFNSEFRNLAKTEIAKFAAQDRLEEARLEEDRPETAQAVMPKPVELAQLVPSTALKSADERPTDQPNDVAAQGGRQIAQGEILDLPKPAAPERVAQEPPQPKLKKSAAFLDTLENSVNSGDLSNTPELTPAAMMDYARRTYGVGLVADNSGSK